MASSVKVLNAVTFQEIDMQPANTNTDQNYIPESSNGTAIDPATGNIWIGNGTRVRVYNQAGTRIAQYGASGTALGQFQDIADLVYCNGQIYIADERQSKITVANLDGTFVTRWGQTFGQNPYDFRGPAGMDCDAQGRIYVADSGNDRIQVFNTNNIRTFEAVAPSAPVVSSPAQSAVLPLNSVTLTGTAADNSAVGNVELAVQDYTSGLYWNSQNSSWEAAKTYSMASYTANTAPATSVSWRFVFPGVKPQGRYVVEVRTRDHNGNTSQPVMRTFAMTGATAPPVPPPVVADNVRPDGTLIFPAPPPAAAANLPNGLVHFTGNATDNVGVSVVKIALKRNSDGRWWTGTGSSGFGTTYTSFDATLATPGGPSTGWSWDWTPRAAGAYTIQVEARDATGNVDSSKPNVVFNVTSDAPDTVAPDTSITAPANGATLPTGNVTIAGGATDDKQVSAVRLSITERLGPVLERLRLHRHRHHRERQHRQRFRHAVRDVELHDGRRARGQPTRSTPSPRTRRTTPTRRRPRGTSRPPAHPTRPRRRRRSRRRARSTPRCRCRRCTISGNVTDNSSGVATVRIAIQNTATLQWWNGTSSTWGAFAQNQAVVAAPGSTSTTWSYSFAPPAAGRYGYQVTAVDSTGNVSGATSWRTVTLQ